MSAREKREAAQARRKAKSEAKRAKSAADGLPWYVDEVGGIAILTVDDSSFVAEVDTVSVGNAIVGLLHALKVARESMLGMYTHHEAALSTVDRAVAKAWGQQ